jgi:competence protein ComFB
MQLVNFMEEAVKRAFEELLQEPVYQSLNLPENTKLDIIAYSLNHLPPRYVVTEKGRIFSRIDELKHQFKADIIIELSKAIQHILANPR